MSHTDDASSGPPKTGAKTGPSSPDSGGKTASSTAGQARTQKKAAAARDNGRAGGRPARWSHELLVAAAACLSQHAQTFSTPLREELLRFAQAIEARDLHLRDRRRQAPKVGRPSKIRIVVRLRITGGKSNRGRLLAEEEIVDRVLRGFQPQRGDGWEYTLVLPHMPEADLDQLLSMHIPSAAQAIAAKRHCKVDYAAHALDDPRRSWVAVPALASIPTHHRAELEVVLQCPRGKKMLEDIEQNVSRRFPMRRRDGKPGQYQLDVWYTTPDDLERIVGEFLDEVADIVRERRRFISYDIHQVDRPHQYWSGTLPT